MRKTKKTRSQSIVDALYQSDHSEVYRQLRTNIEFSSFEKKIQVINFTSTHPVEGKSTVVTNLAAVFAAKYSNVLLIDCDLRKPVQHKAFKVTNKIGLSDLIKDLDNFNVGSDIYFHKFKDENSNGKLYLLAAGTKVPNPQEMLSSEKFKTMMEKLKTRFDLILLDCPPIMVVADAIPISNVADGTIFIVSARDTNKNEAKAALTQLQRNGAHILGSVLTKVDTNSQEYYYYYDKDNE